MGGLRCCNSLPVSPILTLTIPSSPLQILYLPLGCLSDIVPGQPGSPQPLWRLRGSPSAPAAPGHVPVARGQERFLTAGAASEKTMFWADTTHAKGRQFTRREEGISYKDGLSCEWKTRSIWKRRTVFCTLDQPELLRLPVCTTLQSSGI